MKKQKRIFTILVLGLAIILTYSSVLAISIGDSFNREYIKGDVNQDRCITEEDGQMILKISVGEIEYKDIYLELGDINNDGKLNADDTKLIYIYSGNASNFKKGDVNRDSYVTEDDSDMILEIATGKIEYKDIYLEIGDINNDGALNADDAKIINMYVTNASNYKKGDINRDGFLNEDDANMALLISVGKVELKDIHFVLGDMDNNGRINADDAKLMLIYVNNASNFEKGDVNRDGKLTIEDTEMMQKIIDDEIECLDIYIKIGDLDNDGEITLTDYFKLLVQVKNPADYEKGDINMDGKINLKDWNILYGIINETTKYDDVFLIMGDLNNDNKVDMIDWTRLYEIINERCKKGDLDENDVVNANDAAIALDIYKNGNATEDQLLIGDLDKNGVINANDAALILDMYKNGN